MKSRLLGSIQQTFTTFLESLLSKMGFSQRFKKDFFNEGYFSIPDFFKKVIHLQNENSDFHSVHSQKL